MVGNGKGRKLNIKQVKALLPETELVIADIGSKLNWIEKDLVYKTWRTELKDHLSDSPGDFNSDYFYYASLWVGEGRQVVLLEKYH